MSGNGIVGVFGAFGVDQVGDRNPSGANRPILCVVNRRAMWVVWLGHDRRPLSAGPTPASRASMHPHRIESNTSIAIAEHMRVTILGGFRHFSGSRRSFWGTAPNAGLLPAMVSRDGGDGGDGGEGAGLETFGYHASASSEPLRS